MEGLLAAVCRKRKHPSGSEDAPSNRRRQDLAKTAIETSPFVRLNVGGKEYVTSRSTLRRGDSGMLAKMFESNLPSATIGGAYFIDRDGDLFRFVLSYLRDGAVELPGSFQELRRLEREANFFMLPGMLQLIRSKMSEVHLEVRLFAEPFGCTAEQCNCGCGDDRIAHPDAFSYEELETMDLGRDEYRDHPGQQKRPEFKSPFAVEHVCLHAVVPRESTDRYVRVETLASPEPNCGGDYFLQGSLNERPLYKNEAGAVMLWSDGCWRINADGSAGSWLLSPLQDSDSEKPPTGLWWGPGAGMCSVDGEEVRHVEGCSLMQALQAVRQGLVEREGVRMSVDDIDEILKSLKKVFSDFVRQSELSSRILHAPAGKYDVGDAYDKKDQFKHFATCVKIECRALHSSRCTSPASSSPR
ncbi:Kctd8 [Symbiodinium sp. CCMP2456]|nr:Kctd8 [Symbiodinium sp. CCMP2456]